MHAALELPDARAFLEDSDALDVLAGSINAETGAANAASYAAMINASKVSLDVTANAEGITAKAQSNEDAAATLNANAGAETTEGK